jgi:hypothetical protein
MSTPALRYNAFFIVNTNTSRYIVADSYSSPGTPIKTATALDQSTPNNNRFTVTCHDEKYGIMNVANNFSLAPGKDSFGNPVVVWSSSSYWWDAPTAGPGIWAIMQSFSNARWNDSQNASDHTIKLLSDSTGSGYEWQFIAA